MTSVTTTVVERNSSQSEPLTAKSDMSESKIVEMGVNKTRTYVKSRKPVRKKSLPNSQPQQLTYEDKKNLEKNFNLSTTAPAKEIKTVRQSSPNRKVNFPLQDRKSG